MHAGQPEQACSTFEKWRAGELDGLPPGQPLYRPLAIAFNTFLAASIDTARSCNPSLLADTLAEMDARGVVPNQATFNPHAYLAYKQRNLPLAEMVLAELRRRGITPSITTYCHIIATATAAFRLRFANSLLAEMEAEGLLTPAEPSPANQVKVTLSAVVRGVLGPL